MRLPTDNRPPIADRSVHGKSHDTAVEDAARLLEGTDWSTHALMCGKPPEVLFRREVHRIVVAALLRRGAR